MTEFQLNTAKIFWIAKTLSKSLDLAEIMLGTCSEAKVIQQLLGHRDVKTTITVHNSVNSEYIRQTTDKFNERVKEDQMLLNDKKREEILEQRKDEFVADMDDDEFDEILTKLLEERKERKRRRESDMEM